MVTRQPASASKVAALVLAGGAGTRMGGGKLRRLWRGRPLVTWALEAALASPTEAVWLVTGADEALADLAPAEAGARLQTIHAGDWAHGLSATLRAGIAALPKDVGAVLIFLGDMPSIPMGGAEALVAAWRDGAVAAAPEFGGVRGHPALLDRSLFGEAMQATGDRGAGPLLAELGERLVLIPTLDDGVLFDVDTPQALEA
ncbi:hypothetical protein BH09PSE2_BH09PSE2_17280 [soil metagenome]